MSIKCSRFDENWAPIGTLLRIIETVQDKIHLVYYGYVYNYSDDMSIMNIHTVDCKGIDINVDELYRYIIERCVPEGVLYPNTIDLDYADLMNIVDGSD